MLDSNLNSVMAAQATQASLPLAGVDNGATIAAWTVGQPLICLGGSLRDVKGRAGISGCAHIAATPVEID